MSTSASARKPAQKKFERKQNLKVACIQFSPIYSDPRESVDLVGRIIDEEKLEPNTLDLVVLPELALTGYVFDSEEQIRPLLEDINQFENSDSTFSETASQQPKQSTSSASNENLSLQLGRDISKKLNAYTIIGFPEIRERTAIKSHALDSLQNSGPIDSRPANLVSDQQPRSVEASRNYNSAALFSRDGQLVKIFSKHFLFETDEKWAEEGEGFEWVDLPDLGRICVAICMDLNPYQFKSSFSNFELSSFCRKEKVDVLAMPMAWLLSSREDEASNPDSESSKPSIENLNYWAWRLEGIWGSKEEQGQKPPPHSNDEDEGEEGEVVFIAANRIGTEEKSTFGGSSCALRLSKSSSTPDGTDVKRPELLGFLGKGQSGVLKFET